MHFFKDINKAWPMGEKKKKKTALKVKLLVLFPLILEH
jgi:hypothetical protein